MKNRRSVTLLLVLTLIFSTLTGAVFGNERLSHVLLKEKNTAMTTSSTLQVTTEDSLKVNLLALNEDVSDEVVYVRIESDTDTLIPRIEVPLEDFDLSEYGASKNIDDVVVLQAIIKALEMGGLDAKSTDVIEHGGGSYISSICGLGAMNNAGWMYTINDVAPAFGVNEQAIKANDEIVLYYIQDWMLTNYAYFDVLTKEVETEEAFELTLINTVLDMMTWESSNVPCIDADILVDGEVYGQTDENGKILLNFDKEGTYYISAEKFNEDGINIISRPYCEVEVIKSPEKEKFDYHVGISGAINWIQNKVDFGTASYKVGNTPDWHAFALARSGVEIPSSYYSGMENMVKSYASPDDFKAAMTKVTEYERMTLGITASGHDATNVAGVNFIEAIYNSEILTKQGTNGVVYGLLALDSHDYEVPSDARYTREALVALLIDNHIPGAGWGYTLSPSSSSDIDLTAMAIQALTPYYKNESFAGQKEVKAAVDEALDYLGSMQKENGTYLSYGALSSESAAQVLTALSGLGVDCTKDSRFIKEGNTLLDAIGTFYNEADGGFKHVATGASNAMATQQVLYALTAYDRFLNGKNNLYDMTDIELVGTPETDVPEIDVPEIDVPEIDVPETDVPETDIPEIDVPEIDVPEIDVPETDVPETDIPETDIPETDVPETDVPETDVPETDIPETDIPETDIPETDVPETDVPETSKPETDVPQETQKEISVTISVDAKTIGKGYIVSSKTLTLKEDATAFDALESLGLNLETTGADETVYVAAINGLGEFDHGELSGWMYHVNGKYPEVGLGSYTLSDGDVMEVRYTTNGGKDLGDAAASIMGESSGGNGGSGGSGMSDNSFSKTYTSAIGDIIKVLSNKGTLDEWELIALSRKQAINESVKKQLINKVVTAQGEYRKVTDLERMIMALGAAGYDARDVEGINLIEKLYNRDNVTNQGSNGIIFALIALDSRQYNVPENSKWTREKLIEMLLTYQNEDGGFALAKGEASDVDITAMALCSLAPYKDVYKASIEEALTYLSKVQNDNGTYSYSGVESSESTSQVIIALSELGINLKEDTRFIKEDMNLLDVLGNYYVENEGFKHITSGTVDQMATEQALLALLSYEKMIKGESGIYHFEKVSEEESKEENVQVPQLESFTDSQEIANWAVEEMKEAVALGIIQGNEGALKPKDKVTRAEFVTMLLRVLGEENSTESTGNFADVPDNAWYSEAVNKAYALGLINGMEDNSFMPSSAITREQMAVILSKLVKEEAIDKSPEDIDSIAAWSKQGVLMMYNSGLMQGNNNRFEPKQEVTREMTAVILMRFQDIYHK